MPATDDFHFELGLSESLALEGTNWDRFVEACEMRCAHLIHKDHTGKPSFDGDSMADGYSLDWLHVQWMAGKTPAEVEARLLQRKAQGRG